jgi:hypothetical protein
MPRGEQIVLALTIVAATLHAHDGPHTGGEGHEPSSSAVRITERNGYRLIEANGLPDHEHGTFPNRRNPNRIAPQRYSFRVPLDPQPLDRPVPLRGLFGVAINGVVFDPGTAEYWRGDRRWNYEALGGSIDLGVDSSHAHVQPGGIYHYHGIPTGLIDKQGGNDKQMVLLGYAADGFPIFAPNCHEIADDASSPLAAMRSSYQLREGTRPGGPRGPYDGTFTADWEYAAGTGDLDECNGRTGVTPEYPQGTYYYVLTSEFPFIPRLLRGEPDGSFDKRRGPPPGGPRGRGFLPPRGRRPFR